MANNKIIYGGNVLIDLTSDTIEASDVINGKRFHLASGEVTTGTCTYDADTSDADANASDVLSGVTAYVRGSKVTGTMPNRGAFSSSIMSVAGEVTIPNGYHDGSGIVKIAPTEQAKIIAENIREGVEILGVTGTMSGSEDEHPQTKTVTPGVSAATYTPDTSQGYTCFSEFTVNAIPYEETPNAAGGTTVTIAGS